MKCYKLNKFILVAHIKSNKNNNHNSCGSAFNSVRLSLLSLFRSISRRCKWLCIDYISPWWSFLVFACAQFQYHNIVITSSSYSLIRRLITPPPHPHLFSLLSNSPYIETVLSSIFPHLVSLSVSFVALSTIRRVICRIYIESPVSLVQSANRIVFGF